jgi:hypothetical protein
VTRLVETKAETIKLCMPVTWWFAYNSTQRCRSCSRTATTLAEPGGPNWIPPLPAWPVTELTIMRNVLVTLDTEEKARRASLEAAAPKTLPKAIGSLTWGPAGP